MDRRMKKEKMKRRYGRYGILFTVFLSVFFLSAAAEILFFHEGGKIVWGKTELLPLFVRLSSWEAVFYLLTFLLGVTVYSAAFSVFSAILRGFFSGYLIALCFFFEKASDVFLFLLVALYLLGSTWLFSAYSAFAGSVSFRLFSDGMTGRFLREEERMFGGTLFCSTLFQNRINLRFLSSYVLIFLAFFLSSTVFILFYACLRSLFF